MDIALRVCEKCLVAKPLSEFGVTTRGKPRFRCRVCKCLSPKELAKIRNEKYAAAHPDRIAKTKKDNEAKCRVEKNEKLRISYAKDSQIILDKHNAWRRSNPEKTTQYGRRWRSKNPAKAASLCRRRQAAKIQATPLWADNEKIERFYTEARQKTTETGVIYVVDHIIPLRGKAVCGLHCEGNLQVITKLDNSIKSNSFVWEARCE